MNIGSIQQIGPLTQTDAGTTPALTAEQRALIQAVKALNAAQAFGEDNQVTYSVDRAARLVVAKLVGKSTGTVIEQIPAEYVLRMAEKMNGG